jgi:short-subunit dehydrogenase
LAEEYGRHRAKLALAARDQNRLERARTKLLGLGIPPDDVSVFSADLRDSLEAEKLVAAVTRQFGQIDVLVNCAGTITVGPVENQPLHAFEEAIESNYYTMLHSTLAVLPQMLVRQAGSIVNIVSIGGKVAVPHLLPYSASKFAVLGFSQGLHAEMRSKGVHVTTVCTGLMRTGSHTQAYFTGDREREYRWFSLAASMPGLSTSARHAAMRIVSATINRIPEITITPQAYLLARLGQAVPELIAAVMHWTNSLILPQPTDGQSHSSLVAGKEVRGKELKPLTFFGQHAARRYNQQA